MAESDTYGVRILFVVIDKLVLAVAVALIIGYFQQRQERFERRLQEAEEVNSVHIQRPLVLLEELSGEVRDYLTFVESRKALGISQKAEKAALLEMRIKIQTLIEMIGVFSGDSESTASAKVGRELGQTLQGFGARVATNSAQLDDYERVVEDLRRSFGNFSAALVEECSTRIRKFHQDAA